MNPQIDILDELDFRIDPNFSKYMSIDISQDHAIDDIGRFPFYPQKEYKYFSVKDSTLDFRTINETDNIFGTIQLHMNGKYTKIERTNYKIEELIGDLGGIIEILLLVGTFMVGKFSDKFYTSDMITDLYFIKSKISTNVRHEMLEKKIIPKRNNKIEETKLDFLNKEDNTGKNCSSSDKIRSSRTNNKLSNTKDKPALLSDRLRNLSLFKLDIKHLLYMICCCPSLKCRK